MEKIVRPFVPRDISPPKRVQTAQSGAITDTPETVTAEWGKGGTAKLSFGSVTIDETFYSIKRMRERPRQT